MNVDEVLILGDFLEMKRGVFGSTRIRSWIEGIEWYFERRGSVSVMCKSGLRSQFEVSEW